MIIPDERPQVAVGGAKDTNIGAEWLILAHATNFARFQKP